VWQVSLGNTEPTVATGVWRNADSGKSSIIQVSQKERSALWEVIVSIMLSKVIYVGVSYSERSPRYRYGSYNPHKGTSRCTQTSNTPCPLCFIGNHIKPYSMGTKYAFPFSTSWSLEVVINWSKTRAVSFVVDFIFDGVIKSSRNTKIPLQFMGSGCSVWRNNLA
jgi:hypothetical protein